MTKEEILKVISGCCISEASAKKAAERLSCQFTKHRLEIHSLQQSYRLQFDWIAQHYPECYKNIPNPVDESLVVKENARLEVENESLKKEVR